MFIKYGVEESGIYSADFHTKRSWILLGCRTGEVMMNDYEAKSNIFTLKAHSGPIRTVAIHPTQSLFLTGSDDCKVKVWNSDRLRCIVVFKGHTDYVRKTIFHHTYPWVISCSDDCSIRFWNWMSKESICVVTGHIHWVTDIQLFYDSDILVSCSVDNTLRFWDYSSLRNRLAKKGDHFSVSHLFGDMDVMCSHVFEGVTSGVHWTRLNPTHPLLCLGDNKVIRVLNIESMREVRTLTGHFGKISAGAFMKGFEDSETFSLVTVSADKTLKVWSLRSGLCLDTFPLVDKPLSVSVQAGLISLITNTGVSVVKLTKQRPTFTVYKHHLYLIRNNWVVHVNTEKKREKSILKLVGVKNAKPTSLSYNQSEVAILVNHRFKSNSINTFQLYFIQDNVMSVTPKLKNCPGLCSTWVSNNRFANIEAKNQVTVRNLKNEDVNFAGFSRGFLVAEKSKRDEQNIPKCERLFAGWSVNHVLLYEAGQLIHYNLTQRRRIGTHQIKSGSLKSAAWNHQGSLLALHLSKRLLICDASLKVVAEKKLRTGKVKSCAWCATSGALLYTTSNQLRYLLVEGDEGAVCTLDQVLYLTHASENQATFLDRNCDVRFMDISSCEYQFKSAVLQADEGEIRRLASTGDILGESMLKFLKEVGRSDIAVHFVKDPGVRFALAVDLHNVDLAVESAQQLDSQGHWEKVAEMALLFGRLTVAETAYQKAKNFSGLKFLYTVTGQYNKLEKLARIFIVRRDWSSAYEVYLLLGDVLGQADTLNRTNNTTLKDLLEETYSGNSNTKGNLLRGAVPIIPSSADWPSL